jgi:beta-glucosidase
MAAGARAPVRWRWVATAVGAALLAASCTPGDSAPTTTEASSTTTTSVVENPTTTSTTIAPYLDATLDDETRIEDLVARMTLDEKLGQMTLVHKNAASLSQITEQGIGAVLSGGGQAPSPNTPEAWVEMITRFQDAALATRLGIPLLYGSDAVHGHNNLVGAVIFPHNIGLGATGSPDLVERIAEATAVEAAATGVTWNYAPVLAVARDIRWGRTYESFGEDTSLVTELATAYLRGLQGDDLRDPDTILGTPKHFVGDGAAEWGTSTTSSYWIDQGDTSISVEELREIHLAPYPPAIDAGALSIMASYSSFQGTKLHASRELLTDVLKGELGFEGFVVSDWAGIDQIEPEDYEASVITAINAGIDMNMVPGDYFAAIDAVRAGVERGEVSMERIDDAVRRILRAKMALGLFENPYPDPALVDRIGSSEHRELAGEAVEKSMVLLTNDAASLPIDAATIFVAGTAADDIGWQSGGWTISWQGGLGPTTPGTTLLDGIRRLAPEGTAVHYDSTGRFDDEVPARADVGIVAVGERPYAEGVGDNGRLTIDERQLDAVQRVRDRVDTLVVVVVSGRPLMLDEILDPADAIVAAWLPGSEGAAMAGPLFGAVPFTGSLPFTWPRDVEQLPFDGVTQASTGCDGPLFPYGHGLTTDDDFRVDPSACDA